MTHNLLCTAAVRRDRRTQRRHVDLLRVCSAQCLRYDVPPLRAVGAR
jgi:hypothetical protein